MIVLFDLVRFWANMLEISRINKPEVHYLFAKNATARICFTDLR